MENFKNLKFECYLCGGTELEYQKYVKCITPVSFQDDHIEYGKPSFDEEDSLAALNGFVCKSCGDKLEHCGYRIETEKELMQYLEMNPAIKQQQQQEYNNSVDSYTDAFEHQEIEEAGVEAVNQGI
jgi:hypothetical protein